MSVREPIYRYLTDDGLVGDGTNQNANVNGSVTPVPMWAGPSEKMWAVHRLIVFVEDNAGLAADNYGGVATLSNGIDLKIVQGHQTTGNVVSDLMDGSTVKSLAGWAGHCHDASTHSFGAGNNFFTIRWTFSNAGRPLILDSFDNEKLVATINDDLSPLVGHTFMVQGHVIDSVHDQLNTWGS